MLCKIFLSVIFIGVAFGDEDTIFKIRKCCAEDEIIYEKTGGCINSKIFGNRHNIYYTGNETVIGEKGSPGSRPWWFPPSSKIYNTEDPNVKLENFPTKTEFIFGEMQPCEFTQASLLPDYAYHYDFLEDGSIIVKKNDYQKNEVTYYPMSFCVDILSPPDLGSESSPEPLIEIHDATEYVVMLCPCMTVTCVLKCCPPGMSIDLESDPDGESPCVSHQKSEDGASMEWTPYLEPKNLSYHLLHGFPECPSGESTVVPNLKNGPAADQQYLIYPNGSAQIVGETYSSKPFSFCGDNIIHREDDKKRDYIIRCFPKVGVPSKSPWVLTRKILYGSLLIIGTFFLFLTLLVYALLPTVKSINDKNLISQTWSLFIGYFCTAISQLAINQLPHGLCVFFGFLIQYSFLAAFFWLNVLCIDISWTFSELRLIRGIPTERFRKKFIYYSMYAWGCPTIMSVVTAAIEFSPMPDYILKPEIKERCWFRNDSLAKLAYFYGPIAVLLIANMFLFLFTSFRILQTQRDTSSLIRNRTNDKQRFILYLKLFLLMGLSWITELISWAVGGPDYYWYIPDIVNLLRAVFIFVILCCKPQVKEELKKRLTLLKQPDLRRPSNARSNSFFLTTIQLGQEGLSKNDIVSSL